MLLVLALSLPGGAFPCRSGNLRSFFKSGEEILVKYRGKWSRGLILGTREKYFLVELRDAKKTNLWVTQRQMKLTPEAEAKMLAC